MILNFAEANRPKNVNNEKNDPVYCINYFRPGNAELLWGYKKRHWLPNDG
jgi:hypothetical protein